MKGEFIRETEIRDKNEKQKERELIISIILTKKSLEQAHQNFEYAENELIDYYSYKIKANQAKLDYLIRQAKLKGLMLDFENKDCLYEEYDVG